MSIVLQVFLSDSNEWGGRILRNGKEDGRVQMMGCQTYTKPGGEHLAELAMMESLKATARPVMVAKGDNPLRKSMRSLLRSDGTPVGIGMCINRFGHTYLTVRADATKERKLRRKWRVLSEVDTHARFNDAVSLLVAHYQLPTVAERTLRDAANAFITAYSHYL